MKLTREALVTIHNELQGFYGARLEATGGTHNVPMLLQVNRSPMDVLIATILSQNTTDRSAWRCFQLIKQRFPSWAQVAELSVTELAELIKPCGLSAQKAARIRQIITQTGGSLDHLVHMSPDDAFSYLLSMPGVGPKTAACVMLFSLGQPYFPVDTHIRRVVTRLGLVSPGSSAQKVQQQIQRTVPAEIAGTLHVLLIAHGRTCCTARSPRCQECPLRGWCNYALSSERCKSGLVRSDDSAASLTGSMSGELAMSRPQYGHGQEL